MTCIAYTNTNTNTNAITREWTRSVGGAINILTADAKIPVARVRVMGETVKKKANTKTHDGNTTTSTNTNTNTNTGATNDTLTQSLSLPLYAVNWALLTLIMTSASITKCSTNVKSKAVRDSHLHLH